MNAPIPVRPIYPARGPQTLQRACWATVRAAAGGAYGRDVARWARHLFGSDVDAPLILLQRAAVTGATTSAAGWASQLAQHGTADFLAGLGPESAMGEVIRRGVIVPIDDFSEMLVPQRNSAVAGGWVGEASAIPVTTLPLASLTLTPKKAGILIVTTRELARAAGGQGLFVDQLRAVAGHTVDALYLGTAAATAAGLAGLLNGVTPLVSAGSAAGDLGQLAEAVGGTTGSGEVIYIASPGLAAHLNLLSEVKAVVLPSSAVPAGRIIAIDPRAIVHGINPTPDIEASEEVTIHMDSVPLAIGTPGAPATVAAPTISAFQSGQIGFRLLVDMAWVKRSATAAAYINAIDWTPAP